MMSVIGPVQSRYHNMRQSSR